MSGNTEFNRKAAGKNEDKTILEIAKDESLRTDDEVEAQLKAAKAKQEKIAARREAEVQKAAASVPTRTIDEIEYSEYVNEDVTYVYDNDERSYNLKFIINDK